MLLNRRILITLLIVLGLFITMGCNISATTTPKSPYYYYAVGGEVEVPEVATPSILLVLAGVAAVIALTLLIRRK